MRHLDERDRRPHVSHCRHPLDAPPARDHLCRRAVGPRRHVVPVGPPRQHPARPPPETVHHRGGRAPVLRLWRKDAPRRARDGRRRGRPRKDGGRDARGAERGARGRGGSDRAAADRTRRRRGRPEYAARGIAFILGRRRPPPDARQRPRPRSNKPASQGRAQLGLGGRQEPRAALVQPDLHPGICPDLPCGMGRPESNHHHRTRSRPQRLDCHTGNDSRPLCLHRRCRPRRQVDLSTHFDQTRDPGRRRALPDLWRHVLVRGHLLCRRGATAAVFCLAARIEGTSIREVCMEGPAGREPLQTHKRRGHSS